jgi:cytoskeletal protein CcmA (bactofilin family)
MQSIISILLVGLATLGTAEVHDNDHWCGQLPEVLVTAPRPEQRAIVSETHTHEMVAAADRPIHMGTQYHRMIGDSPEYQVHYADFTIEVDHHEPFKRIGDIIGPLLIFQAPLPAIELAASNWSGYYHVLPNDTIHEDVMVSGGNAEIEGVIKGDLAVMGGMVDVTGIINGDVAVAGGNLNISGSVNGDAAVFGGNVTNQGTIDGDLFVVGGTVQLDSGSVVTGDIAMVGGTVDKDDNAKVLGEVESVESEALRNILPRIGRVFRFPSIIPGEHVFTGIFSVAALIVVFLMNLLVLLIFPRAIDRIVEMIQRNIWASVGIGVGIEILYIPIVVLLVVSIIGIVLVPVFMLMVFLAMLFGFSSLSLIAGMQISRGLGWKIENRVGLFSLGWAAFMIIPFIGILIADFEPVGPLVIMLGLVILYVAYTIGLGGVLYALVNKNDKTKK